MSLNVFAQIKVKEGSFHQIEGYVMIDKNEHYDMNNAPMALIKISTENISAEQRRKFTFKGNAITYFDVKFEPGEIHLYISAAAATFIEIIHDDYGKTEYWLPQNLKDFCAYEMVLQYVPIGNDSDLNYLILKADQQDARIYVDDEYVGKQFAHKQLVIGTDHSWRIECELFRTETGKITITNKENVIDVTMLPEFGFLNINTTPENGAEVYINDSLVGKSPYKSNKLSVGNYKVKVTKDNFKTAEKTVTVNDKKTTEENIEMQHLYGSIEISSSPANADVYIDGKHYGKTPIQIKEILIGNHELKIDKDGYRLITMNVAIKENEILKINERLQPEKVSLDRYLSRGIKFVTVNGAYSSAPQFSYGISFGSVKKIGWYVSAMSNFDFTGFGVIDESYEEFILTGESRSTSLSVIGGVITYIGGPVYFKAGAGYGLIIRTCETISGEYAEYTPDTFKGVDLSAGLQFNLRNMTFDIDVVTTNFKITEVKLGIGVNWN